MIDDRYEWRENNKEEINASQFYMDRQIKMNFILQNTKAKTDLGNSFTFAGQRPIVQWIE